MDLVEKARSFPAKPGVYFMKDSMGNIIYVGKAKKLRSRVMQYFQHNRDRSPKINALIENIHDIEYVLTDTELEAFLTECRMIKELKPRYNSQMKNDRKYAYIKISLNEKFPRMSITTEKDETGSLFFGPYTSQVSVERAVAFMRDYFKIRKCSRLPLSKNSSGCLNYGLGLCLGACMGDVSSDDYRKCVDRAVMFLEGKDDTVLNDLNDRIIKAAENLEFEKAAKYRDEFRALRHVLNKQVLIRSSSRGRNILAIEPVGKNCYKVFLFKGNRLLNTWSFSAENTSRVHAVDFFANEISDSIKVRYHGKCTVLSQQDIDEAQIIYSYLKKRKNDIKSYWLPTNWFSGCNSRLKTGVDKIIGTLFS